jgi:hypothetical protein
MVAAVLCCAVLSAAQEEIPQIIPLEKKPIQNQKKDLGPRALGLLQMTSHGKVTLVPIAIMINGKFYDATAYKAAPVPMALESGTVYEGERTGKSVGLFTVNGALRSQMPNAAIPWLGTGSWLPAGTEAPKTTRKAESVPVGIEGTDEGPPRLTRPKPESSAASPPAAPQTSSAPPASSSPQQTSAPPASSGPPSGSAPAGTSPPAGSQAPPAATKPETPPSKSATAGAAPSDSGAGEAYRPILRRGKPTQPLPEDEVLGYSRPNAAGAPTSSANAKAVAAASLGPVELVPAISDAGGPEPHSFIYEWNDGEERDRIKQMLALASDQLHDYLKAEAKKTIAAKPTGPKTSRATPAAKANEPVFDNVKMHTFDLWSNNQPVLVLTAEAHLPAGPGAAASAGTTYAITLAARTDIYSNLHKLYAGITDKYHLDITPRLELIDAVDADGDGRGELLFRETSDIGSGYVLYRATADSLWKMFDSLNPE